MNFISSYTPHFIKEGLAEAGSKWARFAANHKTTAKVLTDKVTFLAVGLGGILKIAHVIYSNHKFVSKVQELKEVETIKNIEEAGEIKLVKETEKKFVERDKTLIEHLNDLKNNKNVSNRKNYAIIALTITSVFVAYRNW